jgi:hypothetical protein
MGSAPEAAQVREAMKTVASFAQFEVHLLVDGRLRARVYIASAVSVHGDRTTMT